MQIKQYTYKTWQKVASIFLMATLLWLTVSTPFIMSMQQKQLNSSKIAKALQTDDTQEDAAKSASNNVDEKAPSGFNFAEEFLHEHHNIHYPSSSIDIAYRQENARCYIAYYGELHAPPPNIAS